MKNSMVESEVTIWTRENIPSHLFYAGRRWRVSDTPTRLRESVWSLDPDVHRGMYGWRFQATDEAGESVVFDVYPSEKGWHVHHTYV